MYFVYILQSEKDGSFYKGYSEHPFQRLIQHNNGESAYTSNKMPWVLIFVQSYANKKEALIREKNLKKYSVERIEKLVASPANEITFWISNWQAG